MDGEQIESDVVSKPPGHVSAVDDIVAQQPTFETESMKRLSLRYVALERQIGSVVSIVVLVAIIASTSPILYFAGQGRWWVILAVLTGWLFLAAVMFFFAIVYPKLAFERTRWRLGDEGFEIHRGVLWKHQIAIPPARVQHVDVSQGPLQRMKDLGKLTIHTAGTKNASIELDGLDHAVALEVRDKLIVQKELLDE